MGGTAGTGARVAGATAPGGGADPRKRAAAVSHDKLAIDCSRVGGLERCMPLVWIP